MNTEQCKVFYDFKTKFVEWKLVQSIYDVRNLFLILKTEFCYFVYKSELVQFLSLLKGYNIFSIPFTEHMIAVLVIVRLNIENSV